MVLLLGRKGDEMIVWRTFPEGGQGVVEEDEVIL